MNTLNLLYVILATITAIHILKVILKARSSLKKTFKIKDDIRYIVNVKSIKKAIEVADDHDIFISKEDLEETDINVPKRWASQIISEEMLIEIMNINPSKKSKDEEGKRS